LIERAFGDGENGAVVPPIKRTATSPKIQEA